MRAIKSDVHHNSSTLGESGAHDVDNRVREEFHRMSQPMTVHPFQKRKNRGFTLIEVLIVIAIIGIIAAVGYPSYTEYVKQSRRADGHLALLNTVQSMERCKTTRFTYTGCNIPAGQTTSPEGFYTIALGTVRTDSTFTVIATPAGPQAQDTDCASISIDQVGQRLPTECW